MGLTLIQSNPIYEKTVRACAAVVEPLGVDLMAEFENPKGWKTPLLGALGLLAVQIGLVDVLREEFGIVPSGMLGHSAGRSMCRYPVICMQHCWRSFCLDDLACAWQRQ